MQIRRLICLVGQVQVGAAARNFILPSEQFVLRDYFVHNLGALLEHQTLLLERYFERFQIGYAFVEDPVLQKYPKVVTHVFR
jgi:hypothetical protein